MSFLANIEIGYKTNIVKKSFKIPKGVVRSCKSEWTDNVMGKRLKDKRTNNDLQNITQKA